MYMHYNVLILPPVAILYFLLHDYPSYTQSHLNYMLNLFSASQKKKKKKIERRSNKHQSLIRLNVTSLPHNLL